MNSLFMYSILDIVLLQFETILFVNSNLVVSFIYSLQYFNCEGRNCCRLDLKVERLFGSSRNSLMTVMLHGVKIML